MYSPWLTLEAIPGLIATETVWQQMVGEQFPAFKSLCLQSAPLQVERVPCPEACGCDHRVVRRHDGTGAVGVCRCQPQACPDIPLTASDITALEVNHTRLGYALCQAFELKVKHALLPAPNTFQFGAWSVDAVPAILTIQVQRSVFRRAVAEVAAQLRQPFILFAPTADFLDAPAQGILENHRAAFYALNAQVRLTEAGTLQPLRPPGELFARFTPQPRETDLDAAARAFALVRQLHTDFPLRRPDLLTVFRHYCMENLSAAQIARRYDCSKPTVLRRLALIHERIGIAPKRLRELSPWIAQLEESLRDSRAARLRPRDFLEEPETE